VERYIGLDVHQASSTFVVMGPSGKKLRSAVVETNGQSLIEFMKLIPGTKHLCFEEGTQSEWLYEILSPHARETVVVGLGAFSGRGQKSDKLDALGLANLLRTGGIERRVFKAKNQFGRLRDLARVHVKVVDDVVRAKNRLRALYRSRGICTPPGRSSSLYEEKERAHFLSLLPARSKTSGEILFMELSS